MVSLDPKDNRLIAFHLDLKTIHYRQDYLAVLFLRLASAGYTHVFVELEDKVQLDTLKPAVWFEAWTKPQFAQVLADIRHAGMVAIPLIQTLGHLEFVLSHKAHHPLRETPGSAYQLCPSNPRSVSFAKRYMDEVGELFENPPLFHIGADEAWSLGRCPSCATRVAESSKSHLFQEYTSQLFDHALSRGARPVAWADVLLAYSDAVDRFSRDTIWMDWDYWSQDQGEQVVRHWTTGKNGGMEVLTPEFRASDMGKHAIAADGSYRPWFYTDYLIDKGFDVIIAPSTRCGGDHVFAPDIKHPGNVMSAVNRMQQSPAPIGMLVTSWALRLNHLETQWPALLIPKVAAAKDPKPKTQLWRDLAPALAVETFGVEAPEFFEAWELIAPSVAAAESVFSLENDIHYYGQLDAIPTFLNRLAKAAGLAVERTRAQTQLPGYEKAITLLDQLEIKLRAHAKDATAPLNRTFRLWQFAAKAMHARAQETLLFLDHHEGHPNPTLAAEYLLRLEGLQDEYRELLLETATPGSVHRELGMVFAEPWRHLMRLAAARGKRH